MRKNIHIPDELMAEITDIRHEARYPTETGAIVALLTAATHDIRAKPGFTYLAVNGKNGSLKIGFSANPLARMKSLTASERSPIELIGVLYGGRMMEAISLVMFGRFRVRGEWFHDRAEIREWFKSSPFSAPLDIKEDGEKRPSHLTERLVPFTPELFDAVNETRIGDGRAFKYQAAALIKEAIEARKAKANNA